MLEKMGTHTTEILDSTRPFSLYVWQNEKVGKRLVERWKLVKNDRGRF